MRRLVVDAALLALGVLVLAAWLRWLGVASNVQTPDLGLLAAATVASYIMARAMTRWGAEAGIAPVAAVGGLAAVVLAARWSLYPGSGALDAGRNLLGDVFGGQTVINATMLLALGVLVAWAAGLRRARRAPRTELAVGAARRAVLAVALLATLDALAPGAPRVTLGPVIGWGTLLALVALAGSRMAVEVVRDDTPAGALQFRTTWLSTSAVAVGAVALMASAASALLGLVALPRWEAPPWLVRTLGWLVVQTVGRIAAVIFWFIERFYAWLTRNGVELDPPGAERTREGLLAWLSPDGNPGLPPWLDASWRWGLGAVVVAGVAWWLWLTASARREREEQHAAPVERSSALSAGRVAADLASGLQAAAGAAIGALYRPLDRQRGVRRLYRRLLADLRAAGVPREPHVTAHELIPPATTLVPELDGELRALTEAYVGARYAERQPPRRGLRTLRAAARRLHAALVPRVRPGEPGERGGRSGGHESDVGGA